MKIVCDCGNEAIMTLKEDDDYKLFQILQFNDISKYNDNTPFRMMGGYDGEVSITCMKCGESLTEER